MERQAARILDQLGIEDEEVIGVVNEDVVAFARERAAELVGMRRTPTGEIVPNPSAEWSITETTREGLRSTVTKAVEEGWTRDQLRDAIEETFDFSEDRARMIAQTELSFANAHANLAAWKASGVVVGRRWILSDDHEIPDECDDNASQDGPFGPGTAGVDEPFISGHFAEPAHPNCWCSTIAILSDEYAAVLEGDEE